VKGFQGFICCPPNQQHFKCNNHHRLLVDPPHPHLNLLNMTDKLLNQTLSANLLYNNNNNNNNKIN